MGTTKTSRPRVISLPSDLQAQLGLIRGEILQRLADFSRIDPEQYFYELCYCLLTPQSKAVHAEAVVSRLKEMDFLRNGGEAVTLLRNPSTYIRFHNVKANRLHAARENWLAIERLLTSVVKNHQEPHRNRIVRNELSAMVEGFGMKESSHYLRNIGFRGIAIIDRHLLTNLLKCGVIESVPSSISQKKYLKIEHDFAMYSELVGVDMDELDLLFWSAQTGFILK